MDSIVAAQTAPKHEEMKSTVQDPPNTKKTPQNAFFGIFGEENTTVGKSKVAIGGENAKNSALSIKQSADSTELGGFLTIA